MLVAAAAMASVSCQKEENAPVNETKSATLTLQATVADTKTYIEDNAVLWGTGEYVQLYFNDGADKYVKSKEDAADLWEGEASAMFSFDITYDPAESYVIGGVYPASAASISDDETSAKAYKLELPATQNATAISYDPAAYIMIMQPQTVTAIEADAYLASFRRATALNKITLTGVSDNITSVEITVPEEKALAGRRYFDLTTGVEGEIYYSKTNTVKVNAAYSPGSIDVWFTSWGVELAEGDELTVKMTSATKTYIRTIAARAEGIKFVEGDLNKLTVNMSSAEEEVLDNLSGEYLIAAMPGEWMLMSGTNAGSYYNRFESAIASSASDVLCSDFYGVTNIENYVWKVTKMEGGYSVQNNSTGKYLNLTADGNNAHTSDVAVAFDITVTDKVAKVVPKNYTARELEYNSSNPRFAFYKNTQKDIYFIPWVEDSTPRISVPSNSIEVDAGATSCEFTYDLHNITGTPDVSVALGATMTNVDASVEGNTVTVEFDDNFEEIVKTATVILSIYGADDVEVTITQKAYVDTSVIKELTVSEFKEKEVSTDVWYKLTGTISNIYNTTYGNFYLTDEAGDQVTVYGLKASESADNTTFASLGLKEGDVVTLIGNRSEYNSTPQVGNAYYVSHITACDAPIISFANNIVTITAEGTIYYTTDDSDPTTSSELYSTSFEITETKTVKAIAVADGKAPSLVASKKCTYVDPNVGGGDVVVETGTVLWSDDWGEEGVNSTAFASNLAIASYEYSGRGGYGDNATNVTYTSDASNNVRITKSTGGNCSGGHLWFNKSVAGELKTSAINLYGVTSLSFSHSQGTSGSSCESYYSIDGGASWIQLGTQSGAIATKTYEFTVPEGTASIMIKLAHPSSNSKNTRVDNLTLKAN